MTIPRWTYLLGAALMVLAVGYWFFGRAQTPAITDAEGNPVPGSIASIERVKLGRVEQWLVIRGHNVDNPVLLFLSGGTT